MQIVKIVVAALICVGIGYGVGRYLQPAKIQVKTETVVKEVVKKDVKTVVRTVRHKDGTIERVRETQDRTTKNTDSKSNTQQIVTSKKLDWNVSAMVAMDNGQPVYGASVQRRILGTVYLGVFSLPGMVPVGASIGMSF